MKRTLTALAALATLGTLPATPASAGTDPFVGEIAMYGFNFCPRGWLAANGQLLAISQNQALFSLYGTTYGGDGRTTFALPDLRSRVPVHNGRGPGLSDRRIGAKFGSETNTLNNNQLPSHDHTVTGTINAAAGLGTETVPVGHTLAITDGAKIYASGNGASMASGIVTGNTSAVGGNQPINNIQPSLAINFCVATQGVYPSRP